MLRFQQRILEQPIAVQIAPVHIHGRNAGIVVGGVIVNTLVGVDAGGIYRDLTAAIGQTHAPTLLIHRPQNVKERADALLLSFPLQRIQLHKCRPDKSGG